MPVFYVTLCNTHFPRDFMTFSVTFVRKGETVGRYGLN